MKRFDPSLYLIADQGSTHGRAMEDLIRHATSGGVTLIQWRDKEADLREFEKQAASLIPLLCELQIPLVINDHAEVACRLKVDGLHLGQDDMDPREARELLGRSAILGLTIHNLEELKAAPVEVLDYVAASPVFSTATKSDAGPAMGIEGFIRLRKACSLPLVAIGGIGLEQVAPVILAGADGLAVASAILNQSDVEASARAMSESIKKSRGKRP